MKLKRKVTYRPELVEQGIELSVRHLKQFFNFGHGRNSFKTKAVHDVSFDIKKGECFGLVGESGCGKTTTGRSLIRLYHITSGSIYFEGYRISAGRRWNDKEIKWSRIKGHNKIKEINHEYSLKIKEEKDANKKKTLAEERDLQIKAIRSRLADIRKEQKEAIAQIKYDNKHVDRKLMSKMQMIFQDPVDSLDPRMTVEDIIQEGLRIQGEHNRFSNSRKVAEVLERVGLIPEYASRYPHEFSGGQRQRIGIARALVMKPQFLICDEPISALDVSIRAQIINLLNDLKEEMGLTIMFIAHDLSVVKYFCDRIGVMYFGQLVELATSDELFKHPLHPYTNALLSAIPKPDPISEKKRQRIVYKPQEAHDYSKEKPQLVEITPGHWVLANKPEYDKYCDMIRELDKKDKRKSVINEFKPIDDFDNVMDYVRKDIEDSKTKKEESKSKEQEKVIKSPAKAEQKKISKEEKQNKIEAQHREEQAILKAKSEMRKAEDKERREKVRASRNVVPDILKSDFTPTRSGDAIYSKEEQRMANSLRRYRPEIVPAEVQPQEPVKEKEERIGLFENKDSVKDNYVDLPMFHEKNVVVEPVKEEPIKPEVEAPKLATTKTVYLSRKDGQYILRQNGEEGVIGSYASKEEAMKYAYAIKQSGVAVCARDKKGKLYTI